MGKKYLNSICRICGSEYHRCNCRSEGNWRKVTDTAEHYQIFIVLRDYNNEIIDARKANELLNKLDLSGIDGFTEDTKNAIKKIKKAATPVVVAKPQTQKPQQTKQKQQVQYNIQQQHGDTNNYKK